MKKLGLTLIILFAAGSALAAATQPKWMEAENWGKLKRYMHPNYVSQVLGNPVYKESNPKAGIWYYQASPQIEGTKIIRPNYGLVRFRKMGRGGFVVLDWKEPKWDILPKVEVEEPNKPAEPTAAELEAIKRKAKKLEEEKRRAEERAKRAELARQEALREQNESKKFMGFEREHLYIGGGILLGIAGIYVVFSKAH